MFNDKILKSVAEAVKQVMEAELSTKQKAIAKMSEPKHKIDSGDLSKLRAGHKPVKEAVVKGKGYDNPENERKAPEGHAPMTSLMPGHDERAAKFLARQAKGTLVKGKAGSAPQKEPGMKKEEVELDEAQSHQAKTTMKHIPNPTAGEKKAAKDIKPGVAGYRDRIAMLKSAEARGGLKKEEVKIEESGDLGPVKKKQKTVMVVHKTSGREKVIVDTPENRKRHAEMGFHPIKESVEQIDELKKSTLASYVKKASHDVAAKGATTRQFANDSEAARKGENYSEARKKMQMADKTFAKSWKRREGMAKAVDKLAKESIELDERTLSSDEMEKREKYVKSMKKGLEGFKQRYGERAKEVMYATATKMAKKD
jgi:hypothetical protein